MKVTHPENSFPGPFIEWISSVEGMTPEPPFILNL
jgi:hypothetical protein